MQKLVDSCSGYSLNFVKCMTRKLNELLKTKTCGGNCECNEHRQATKPQPKTKPPEKTKKPTIIVGSTSTDDCKT